jgi:hypothetical protein
VCRELAPDRASIRRVGRTGGSPTRIGGRAGGVMGSGAVGLKERFVEIAAWKRVPLRGWRGVY